MAKKFSVLMAAVAVLAFAVPAMASASTGLTNPKTTLVPVGTTLVGKNVGTPTATATSVGTLTCKNVELRGKVTANSSSGIAGNSGGEVSKAATCERNGSQAITVDNIKLESLSSSAAEAGEGRVTASYIAHIGSLNCTFKLENVKGTYKSETDELTLTKQPQKISPAACGTEGGLFDGTFTLTTTGGSPIYVM